MKVSGGDGTRGTSGIMGINRYEVLVLIVAREWLLIVNEDVHVEELAGCKVVHTEWHHVHTKAHKAKFREFTVVNYQHSINKST